jgi:putative acetyltransferase
MLVRTETPDDFDATRRIHTEAFARSGRDGPVAPEVALTDELRCTTAYIPELSLVAIAGSQPVGHVISTRATIGPDACPVLGLGPLGVLPSHQRQGVGIALMEEMIERVESMGEPMIVLLGDPAYYSRFGFESSSKFGIDPPVSGWAPHFQVRPGRTYDASVRGLFTYAEPFDRV